MLEAERAMKDVLGRHTLADVAQRVAAKAPVKFMRDASAWFGERHAAKQRKRAKI